MAQVERTKGEAYISMAVSNKKACYGSPKTVAGTSPPKGRGGVKLFRNQIKSVCYEL